jgi:hypothetical protein
VETAVTTADDTSCSSPGSSTWGRRPWQRPPPRALAEGDRAPYSLVDLEFAQETLSAAITRPREVITVDGVLKAVANYYGLKPRDIRALVFLAQRRRKAPSALIERSSRPWDERRPDRDRRSAYDLRASEHQAAFDAQLTGLVLAAHRPDARADAPSEIFFG